MGTSYSPNHAIRGPPVMPNSDERFSRLERSATPYARHYKSRRSGQKVRQFRTGTLSSADAESRRGAAPRNSVHFGERFAPRRAKSSQGKAENTFHATWGGSKFRTSRTGRRHRCNSTTVVPYRFLRIAARRSVGWGMVSATREPSHHIGTWTS